MEGIFKLPSIWQHPAVTALKFTLKVFTPLLPTF